MAKASTQNTTIPEQAGAATAAGLSHAVKHRSSPTSPANPLSLGEAIEGGSAWSADLRPLSKAGREPALRLPDANDRLIAALGELGVAAKTLELAQQTANRDSRELDHVLSHDLGLSDPLMARAIARSFGISYLRPLDITIDRDELEPLYGARSGMGPALPLETDPDKPRYAMTYGPNTMLALGRLSAAHDPDIDMLALMTRQTMTDAISHQCPNLVDGLATGGLRDLHPGLSAATGLAAWQVAALIAIVLSGGLGLVIAPWVTLFTVGFFMTVFFALHTGLRTIAVILGFSAHARNGRHQGPPRRALRDEDLPIYTVIIPLHREADQLQHIAEVVGHFDYPTDKLDVKLLLETSDIETLDAALAMRWPSHVSIFQVPDLGPKTKPKAMNAALPLAIGSLVVIYDAEDNPDPGQLRIAAETFAAMPDNIGVLQARLTLYNRTENWLAGQFAIEYAAHFGFLLPALERMGIPVPLGGTSNHIRTDILRKSGGWDPYNVTEDADLGVRLDRLGYRTRLINSSTDEEAACQAKNWIRQRTRWQKGWMQTYGVQMRRPVELLVRLGLLRFIGFQAMIGGLILSPIAHLGFLALAIIGLMQGWLFDQYEGLFWSAFAIATIFNLVCGYGASMALGLLAVSAEGWDGMRLKVLGMPLYWLMIAYAAFRAIGQLVSNPFDWEKTSHGVSGIPRPVRRRRAA